MADTFMDTLFAPGLVSCMAGCDPDVRTLFTVACPVWLDGAAERSMFGWDQLSPTHSDRINVLRIAQAAFAGKLVR